MGSLRTKRLETSLPDPSYVTAQMYRRNCRSEHPKSSPASIADSSLRSQRLKTSQNFCILRPCSHVVRFIDRLPYGGHKTGQLVCYITRTTHLLTTRSNQTCCNDIIKGDNGFYR